MKKYICLILCLSLCAALLSGCSLLALGTVSNKKPVVHIPEPKPEDVLTESSAPSSATEELPAPEPEVQPALSQEEPILDTSTVLPEYYSYHLPQINCETADALAINQEIRENFGTLIDEGCAEADQGYMPVCHGIDYEYHWFEDILVLRVWSSYPNDCNYYSVWSFDRLTGTRLTNADIFALCGVDTENFVNQARAAVADEFYSGFPAEHWEDVDRSVYADLVEWSQSEENINLDMRCFPAEDGSLMLISKIGSFAGASSYEHIYPYIPTTDAS